MTNYELTNYDCIKKMSISQMEVFLDEIYCAGLNTGIFASKRNDIDILDENPFSVKWLTDKAEPAVLPTNTINDERECLNAFVKMALRNAEIEYDVESECD